MATPEDVRAIVEPLPRAYEREVSGRAKFRVGSYVFAALSPAEDLLGFAFPRDERDGLVAGEPDKFLAPLRPDERYNWVRLRLAAVEVDELRELLTDAWALCVPKSVAAQYFASAARLRPAARPSAPTAQASRLGNAPV